MKTLSKITLLAALIIITAQPGKATNPKIHRVLLNSGNYLEVIIEEEEEEEEALNEPIPGHENFIKELNESYKLSNSEIEIYEEPEAECNFAVSSEKEEWDIASHEEMHKFLNSIFEPEACVDDIPFCTEKVFNNIKNEAQIKETKEVLIFTINPEKDIEEFYFRVNLKKFLP